MADNKDDNTAKLKAGLSRRGFLKVTGAGAITTAWFLRCWRRFRSRRPLPVRELCPSG